MALDPTLQGRETRSFWVVNEHEVSLKTGYACRDPEDWYIPGVGTCSLGGLIFDTKDDAINLAMVKAAQTRVSLRHQLRDLDKKEEALRKM